MLVTGPGKQEQMPQAAYCCPRYSEAPLYRSFEGALSSPIAKPFSKGALHGLCKAP